MGSLAPEDPIRRRLREARLYLVATPSACRSGLEETVERAIAGGVSIVQLREKDAEDARFLEMARRLRAICAAGGALFLLDDRAHLVAACGADGVHIGEEDMAPEEVRRRFGPAMLLGLSTHDRAEVAAAAGRGADYVGLGPVFPTATKALRRAPGGPALVRDAADATTLPLFPIGGITLASVPALVAAGARAIAVSSAICAAEDPCAAARALLRALPNVGV